MLEYISAFAVLGYLFAETIGRRKGYLVMASCRPVLSFAFIAPAITEILRGYHDFYSASVMVYMLAVLAVLAVLFGGVNLSDAIGRDRASYPLS